MTQKERFATIKSKAELGMLKAKRTKYYRRTQSLAAHYSFVKILVSKKSHI